MNDLQDWIFHLSYEMRQLRQDQERSNVKTLNVIREGFRKMNQKLRQLNNNIMRLLFNEGCHNKRFKNDQPNNIPPRKLFCRNPEENEDEKHKDMYDERSVIDLEVRSNHNNSTNLDV